MNPNPQAMFHHLITEIATLNQRLAAAVGTISSLQAALKVEQEKVANATEKDETKTKREKPTLVEAPTL
jgi:hypothetical protein